MSQITRPDKCMVKSPMLNSSNSGFVRSIFFFGQEVEKALAKARAALDKSNQVESPKALMETDFGKDIRALRGGAFWSFLEG